MSVHGNESGFEAATLLRLQLLGYDYAYGPEIERDPTTVVLVDRLRTNLGARYPELPSSVLEAAVERILRPEGATLLHQNQHFHTKVLVPGFDLVVEAFDGVEDASRRYPGGKLEAAPRTEACHIHPIDWAHPERNDFLVVNQLYVKGPDRIPDIVVYVNGLPLVVFELKNPYDENANVDDAHKQIQHYTALCPKLFEHNALCVISDGNATLHGMWSAGFEWYAPWKSVDGSNNVPKTTTSMEALINGLFPKDRLLAYIRHFILFEVDKSGIIKKGAKYHQFFAVRAAVERTRAAFTSKDQRIGVVWHTTGSGKSLSMAFLVGILRHLPELKSPAFVIQVDRNDLDNQLFDQFSLARDLVGVVKQAENVEALREALRTEGSEVVMTTIEKFALRRGPDGKPIETSHPVLSTRDNIIVIADEAHRSQYGFKEGFARYLKEALPNAKRLGFTGTPISFSGADTVEIFGDYIHTYTIRQAQEDGATVAIYYTARQARLHLQKGDLDAAVSEAAKEENVEGAELETKKLKWAQLAELTGSKERVDAIADDILGHFTERTATLAGKGMIVCMTRANCVRLYEALTALPGCPEVKIVMTGNLKEDPKEWSEKGHITSKEQRNGLKKRMVDAEDPLRLAIVCDMWLTGTDIPCLHTLYIDKPMTGHNMIQAISRVNRVFKTKPHGLVVDYIGVGDELRKATDKYSQSGGGEPAPPLDDKAVPLFLASLAAIRPLLPEGHDWAGWRKLDPLGFEHLHQVAYAHLTDDDHARDAFLDAEHKLQFAHLLVQSLDVGLQHADEIIFYQRVRKQVSKTKPGQKQKRGIDTVVRDLVDDHVESEGVVDIFALAGIANPDISILDDAFLQTFKDQPQQNLRLKLLQTLLADELTRRASKNIAKTRSFRTLLEETLQRYHQRIIDAAAVVQAMVQIKKDLDASDKRAKLLGLDDEELAFYDAVHENYATVYDEPFLRDLIHEVVIAVKKNLSVDWTAPHRDAVKAAVRTAVKRVLRRRGVKSEDFDGLMAAVLAQAEALWKQWPRMA